jgi:predicted phage baseplate assembly protein
LNSGRFRTDFVVETELDGSATLRFGDNVLGKRPAAGATFTATYRVGSGTSGNVGAKALARVVSSDTRIKRVWNPLPASGGADPESLEQVRQYAPQAFRVQERAVTEADYVELSKRRADVQHAAATLRWTGSWYTAFVTVDRRGGLTVDAPYRREMRSHLDRYRLAGYDLEINSPVFVPLEIVLKVCVKAGYFRSDIKETLLRVFSSSTLRGGERGFFHPDNFTFGQPLHLSQIYEAAMAVDGIDSVEVTTFQRWGKAANQERDKGVLTPGPVEVIRLDNDPNFPENGKIEFHMMGGL